MKSIFIKALLVVVFCSVFAGTGYSEVSQSEINANLKTWREFIQKTPNARAYGHLARWLLADKQYEQSIAAAKKSISLDPLNAIVYYNLGDAYSGKEDYKKAILSYERVAEIQAGREHITSSDINNRIARMYYNFMDYENAVSFFKKAVNSDPNNSEFRAWLAWAYYCLGEYENALKHSNKAIEQSKYVGVGMSVGPGKPFPKIIDVFKDKPAEKAGAMVGDEIIKVKGISMKNKNSSQVVFNLIDWNQGGQKGTKVKVLVRRGKRKYNLVMVRDIIGLPKTENSAEMLSERCLMYRKLGDTEKAMKDAKLAIKMAPEFAEAKRCFGAVNLDAGDYEKAIEILSKANQEDVFVLILTAIGYAKQGDIKKARQLYAEKIAGDDSFLKKIPYISEQQKLFNILVPQTEEILTNARQLENKGKFQEALDKYSNAIMFMGKDEKEKLRDNLFQITARMSSTPKISKLAHKYALRAELLVKEGKFKDAVLEFKKALLAAPYSAKLYLNSALVYGKLENYGQAIEQMKIYIKAAAQAPNIQEAEDMIIKWEFKLEREK